MFYALNADTGKAVWASSDARPDEWTSQFLSSDAPVAPLEEYLPWLNRAVFIQQPAPAATLAPPEISRWPWLAPTSRRSLPRLWTIVKDACPRVALTTTSIFSKLEQTSGSPERIDNTLMRK